MQRQLKILIVTVSIIFIIMIGMKLVIPSIIIRQVKAQIENKCETCTFDSESADIKFLPTRLIFNDVHLETGNPKSTLIDGKIKKITIRIKIRKLFKHLIKVKDIVLEDAIVIVTEGDQQSKSSKKDDSPSAWDLEIDHIDLKNSNFTYQMDHLGKRGIIQVNHLNGNIGEMGSTPSRRDQSVAAHATGEVEKSGKLDLGISTILFSKDTFVDVTLQINQLQLNEANRFFEPTSGILMNGKLIDSKASVQVRSRNIHAQFEGNYQNLNIEFKKTFERGGFETVFSNLFSGVKPNKNRTRTINKRRNLQEPLVGFIFRGMKEAALKVVTDK